MTVERRQGHQQSVPGENLHAKPLGTKTWRKPGQIYVEIKNAIVKKNKEIQSLWRRIYPKTSAV
jgi:hypothetical protein